MHISRNGVKFTVLSSITSKIRSIKIIPPPKKIKFCWKTGKQCIYKQPKKTYFPQHLWWNFFFWDSDRIDWLIFIEIVWVLIFSQIGLFWANMLLLNSNIAKYFNIKISKFWIALKSYQNRASRSVTEKSASTIL